VATSPVTGHHGDYWPGNVFIGDGRAEVIDFEGWRDGFPLEDVAYFLQQLDLLFPRSRAKLPELQQAFCSGYFERDRADRKAFELFTMTKALRSLAHGAGAQHPLPLRLWIRSRLRGNVLSPLSRIGDRIANWR
jgi:Ser/Thr protein kinase RdoA (MazF antagonist)